MEIGLAGSLHPACLAFCFNECVCVYLCIWLRATILWILDVNHNHKCELLYFYLSLMLLLLFFFLSFHNSSCHCNNSIEHTVWTTSNSTHIHYTGVTLLACAKLQIKHKSQEKHQITIRLERIVWICFSFHFDFVRRIWCMYVFSALYARVSIFFFFRFIVFGWYKHEHTS